MDQYWDPDIGDQDLHSLGQEQVNISANGSYYEHINIPSENPTTYLPVMNAGQSIPPPGYYSYDTSGISSYMGHDASQAPIMYMQNSVSDPPPIIPMLSGDNWKLIPPPNQLMMTHPPTTKTPKPLGGKTLFIGNLPKRLVEDPVMGQNILREIFGRVDLLQEVRVNARQFAHIRFSSEEAVDRAIWFSGSKIIMDDNETKECVGYLYLDYAANRHDLDEAIRARELLTRGNSPPPVVPFSTTEATELLEKLKEAREVVGVVNILVTWMDRGEVNRRTAMIFYSCIQNVYSHIRRLQYEQAQEEEAFQKVKMEFMTKIENIIRMMEQIKNVFDTAHKQKCWDHFTKAQRKNLTSWKTIVQDIVQRERTASINCRNEDEMEMSASDDEDVKPNIQPVQKKIKLENDQPVVESEQKLFLENASLRAKVQILEIQLQTASRAVTTNAPTAPINGGEKQSRKDKQQMISRLQEDLAAVTKRAENAEAALATANEKASESVVEELHGKIASKDEDMKKMQSEISALNSLVSELRKRKASSSTSPTSSDSLSDLQLKYVGVVITFLLVHPLGASTEYIWSYLTELGYTVKSRDLEEVLERLPECFQLKVTGVGAKIERRWVFTGLAAVSTQDLSSSID